MAQTGCPGCVVTLPDNLPEDTIYLTPAPDGMLGSYYDADLSFRLPKSTDPVAEVDSTVAPGTPLDAITITGVSGLPPGMTWEVNQSEYDLAVETDGCVKFCGTPLTDGFFVVQVELEAQVSIITQPTSFGLPLIIGPASSDTDGFGLENNLGCGSTTVTFTNNVPSMGDPSFTYLWDFGDGTSSTEENPAPLSYTQPGTYIVDYLATIDTFPSTLTEVLVTAVGCTDILGEPDLVATLRDATGATVWESDEVADTDPPVSWAPNLLLSDQTYSLEIRDDDLIGSDICGTVSFGWTDSGVFTDGDLSVTITTNKPVATVSSQATVTVYPIPEAPAFGGAEPILTCPDGEVFFEVPPVPGDFQWFLDSLPIDGATGNVLSATQEGSYFVRFTSPDGCSVDSEMQQLEFITPPPVPEFGVDGNLLRLIDEEVYPEGTTFQWFVGGNPIDGATERRYCIEQTGSYSVQVTDPVTGCSNLFLFPIGIIFQSDTACTTPTDEVAWAQELRIYPNPVGGVLWVELPATLENSAQLELYSAAGTLLRRQAFARQLDFSQLASGVYFLKIWVDGEVVVKRIIRM